LFWLVHECKKRKKTKLSFNEITCQIKLSVLSAIVMIEIK